MFTIIKKDLPPNANLNQIVIRERKLKIGIHNTYTFINSNGIQNSIPLTRRENTLIFKGVSHVDNYFQDEFCAFIFELNYSGIHFFYFNFDKKFLI